MRRTFVIDETVKYPVGLFVKRALPDVGRLFTLETKLFGPLNKADPVYLLGADRLGRDMLSRIVYGTRISMSIGLIGVTLSLVLGIVLGGISGYNGGTVDNIIQRVIEFILSLPTTPLWLGLAAAMPTNWPPLRVYLCITIILSLIGWTSLARVDTRPLPVAPHRGFRHCRPARWGARAADHLPPHGAVLHQPHHRRGQSCHSGNDLAETALSFLGLGLQPPMVSWGVLLQEAQNIRAIATAPWLFAPGIAVVITVLALNFVGDGLRDAADPYSQ